MLSNIQLPDNAKFILMLKALPIKYKIIQEDSGDWSCWTLNGLNINGSGKSYDECRADLISALKDIAEIYINDFEDWFRHNPQDLIYVIKIKLSSVNELLSCLQQEN